MAPKGILTEGRTTCHTPHNYTCYRSSPTAYTMSSYMVMFSRSTKPLIGRLLCRWTRIHCIAKHGTARRSTESSSETRSPITSFPNNMHSIPAPSNRSPRDFVTFCRLFSVAGGDLLEGAGRRYMELLPNPMAVPICLALRFFTQEVAGAGQFHPELKLSFWLRLGFQPTTK